MSKRNYKKKVLAKDALDYCDLLLRYIEDSHMLNLESTRNELTKLQSILELDAVAEHNAIALHSLDLE
jgi:hypothetical protein